MDSFIESMNDLLAAGVPPEHVLHQYNREIAALGQIEQTDEVVARTALVSSERERLVDLVKSTNPD